MDLRSLSFSPYFWSLQDDAFLFTRHSPSEDFSDLHLPARVFDIRSGGVLGPIVPTDTGDGVETPPVFTLLGLTWLNHVHGDGVETPTHHTIFGI